MAKEFKIEERNIQWVLERYKKDLLAGKNVKILWGSRSIFKRDWIILKRFINEEKIKTVIEYGCGLSTELMILENCEVLCLESLEWWGDLCRNAFGNEIITYKDKLPKIDKHFDLALVDGPQQGGRELESQHAIEHANYIWFHDLDRVRLPVVKEVTKNLINLSQYGPNFFRKKE